MKWCPFVVLNIKLSVFAGDEIKDLHARLVGLQQTRESEKEHFQSMLQKAQTELQETKDQLTSENMILSELIK